MLQKLTISLYLADMKTRIMGTTIVENIIFNKAEKTVMKMTKGNYPAPLEILKVFYIS